MNVYILKDPNDYTVKYVGLTSRFVDHRLRMHIKEAKTKRRYSRYLSEKQKRILSLLDKEQEPIIDCMVENITKEVGINRLLYRRVYRKDETQSI